MKIESVIRKIKSIPYLMKGIAKISYSQHGEDIIISDLINRLGLTNVTYLDIGANHPIEANNTYLLYSKNITGVLVEPNPVLFNKIVSKRPKDICLNIGIGIEGDTTGTYYMYEDKYNHFNTFDSEQAKNIEKQGFRIDKTKEVSLVSINSIFNQYFKNGAPTLISIDVEGLDEPIIKSIDLTKYKPNIICVEEAKYDVNDMFIKSDTIGSYLLKNGYSLYASTHVNSIYYIK